MKKRRKYILIIICIFVLLFSIKLPTKADSGWDYDYDYSYDDNYDYDYDSSWGSSNSGSNWNSNSGSYGSGNIVSSSIIILIIIVLAIVTIVSEILYLLLKARKKYIKDTIPKPLINDKYYEDIKIEEFNKIIKDISIDELKNKVFDIYKNIQLAWSSFNYDKLRIFTTDELFNMYSSQLNALEIKQQTNIMEDINKINVKIISVNKVNNLTIIESYLKVDCYDYVIDNKNNKVLRGLKDKKVRLEYIITLVKSSNNKIVKCPNCGAEVNINSHGKCKYCDAVLIQNASDYVMSKKECIGQRVLYNNYNEVIKSAKNK